MSFEIKLPLFQGPFDLLLFFIERDELDIRDIPIAQIADEFLAYIKHLENKNVDVASEFILVAATLMSIKAKMLLPRQEFTAEGTEIDPREDLVKQLMEYKKYKSLVKHFAELEEKRLFLEKRGNIQDELKTLSLKNNVEAELQDVDLYKLLKVYARVIEKYETEKTKPIHTIIPYPYTVEQQKDYIINTLKHRLRVSFLEFVKEMPVKIAVIFNFLAILELLQLQKLHVTIGEGYNNFWIEIQNKSPNQK